MISASLIRQSVATRLVPFTSDGPIVAELKMSVRQLFAITDEEINAASAAMVADEPDDQVPA